jgi:hypothetical protein
MVSELPEPYLEWFGRLSPCGDWRKIVYLCGQPSVTSFALGAIVSVVSL